MPPQRPSALPKPSLSPLSFVIFFLSGAIFRTPITIITTINHHTMRAAAQAYRPRWQAYAYGRGVRHDFRSPTYFVPREPDLRRTIDTTGRDHLLPLNLKNPGPGLIAACGQASTRRVRGVLSLRRPRGRLITPQSTLGMRGTRTRRPVRGTHAMHAMPALPLQLGHYSRTAVPR